MSGEFARATSGASGREAGELASERVRGEQGDAGGKRGVGLQAIGEMRGEMLEESGANLRVRVERTLAQGLRAAVPRP